MKKPILVFLSLSKPFLKFKGVEAGSSNYLLIQRVPPIDHSIRKEIDKQTDRYVIFAVGSQGGLLPTHGRWPAALACGLCYGIKNLKLQDYQEIVSYRVVKRFLKIRLSKFFIVLVFDSQKWNIVSYTSLCNCTNL